MDQSDNLILEHLKAIRKDIAVMADRMDTIAAEMMAMRQHSAGALTLQDHDHADLAAIKSRLDRVERRLEIID